jgi:pimeloyl-ACP methyl ester carboxylesterase
MEQLIDVIIGDIHDAPAPCQCLRRPMATQPVRRLSIRDLLPSSQCEAGVHQALVNGGYGSAAARLANEFPRAAVGLGYSAGGTLLWKAVRLGMQVEALICIASTRLRDEDPKEIQVPTLVVSGGHDPFAPGEDWAIGSNVRHIVLRGCEHGFYITDSGRFAASFHIREFLRSIGSLHRRAAAEWS